MRNDRESVDLRRQLCSTLSSTDSLPLEPACHSGVAVSFEQPYRRVFWPIKGLITGA